MTFRMLCLVCINLAFLFSVSPIRAAEKSESDQKQEGKSKTMLINDMSPDFLKRWKKIHVELKKHAYETQQTRTASGVRGSEAEEDNVLQKLYGTTNRPPSQREMRHVITQIEGLIKAAPEAKMTPEYKLWIAECYSQLAQNAYKSLIEQHPKTEQAKQAEAALK